MLKESLTYFLLTFYIEYGECFGKTKVATTLKQSNKIDFETYIEWLTKLREWIHTQCPYLQMYVVPLLPVGVSCTDFFPLL